jgi:hypothetical protein
VRDDLGRPHHDPLRLTTVVEAPVERLDAVIAANAVLRRLFGAGWVALVALDPTSGERLIRRPDGGWDALAALPAAAPALPSTGFLS